MSKHGLHLWHGMAIHGPKKGPKLVIFPNALFLRFPWDLPTILARRSYPKRPKTPLFRPRSYSKGPNHALEKVLTNETPGFKVEQFLVNDAIWSTFTNDSMWAVFCLSEEDKKFKRILVNHRIHKTQTTIETAQARLQDLTDVAAELNGIS